MRDWSHVVGSTLCSIIKIEHHHFIIKTILKFTILILDKEIRNIKSYKNMFMLIGYSKITQIDDIKN